VLSPLRVTPQEDDERECFSTVGKGPLGVGKHGEIETLDADEHAAFFVAQIPNWTALSSGPLNHVITLIAPSFVDYIKFPPFSSYQSSHISSS
jgi:hypothetical protein